MNTEKPHILVIDDDDRLRSLLAKYLSENGFLVTVAESAVSARRKLKAFIFDLLVLDVMMPSETGIDFLKSFPNPHHNSLPKGEGNNRRTPTLMLSAMGETEDRVRGLEIGAEDYLTKPFEPKELLLRIQAILRRTMVISEKPQIKIVEFGDFRFDLSTAQLKKAHEIISLTSAESAILKFLAGRAGNSATREELAGIMPSATNERSIDVQMSRLRKKIEENDSKPIYLQTIRGAGYVLYAVKNVR